MDLDRYHTEEISPEVDFSNKKKDLSSRVTIVRGFIIYEKDITKKKLVRTVSESFAVTDETAEKYVNKALEWYDDIEINLGIIMYNNG